MINRFPGIKGLAYKDYYTKVNKMGVAIDSDVFKFMPQQFLFP
jgi:hypothetical protein